MDHLEEAHGIWLPEMELCFWDSPSSSPIRTRSCSSHGQAKPAQTLCSQTGRPPPLPAHSFPPLHRLIIREALAEGSQLQWNLVLQAVSCLLLYLRRQEPDKRRGSEPRTFSSCPSCRFLTFLVTPHSITPSLPPSLSVTQDRPCPGLLGGPSFQPEGGVAHRCLLSQRGSSHRAKE